MADRTRGEFLSLTSVGLGAMIGGVIGVPATAYLLAPVTKEVTFAPVFLGKLSAFTGETGFKPTPATYIEDPSNPATSPGLAYVHYTAEQEHRLARRGRHVRRVLEPLHAPGLPDRGHQRRDLPARATAASYDTNGERTAGPPIRSLDRFQWEVKNSDELWITQRWSTDIYGGEVHYYPVKMPGQPTHTPGPSWIANVLYPHVTYTHGPVPGAGAAASAPKA